MLLCFLMMAAVPTFEYNRAAPLDLQVTGTEQREGARIRDVSFASAGAGRTRAYLVDSARAGSRPAPAVLFVHWYEPESPNSNRTQFLSQAVRLAKDGVTSLLVETIWSEPTWFRTRQTAEDFERSVQQVRELRRALDVLLAQPNVDAKRIAYVGHDFGAMFGAVLAGTDPRVSVLALQAGTDSFSHWYLLGRKLEGEDRQKVIGELAPLDPTRHLGMAKEMPILLQFGRSDPYVPEARAEAYRTAAKGPTKLLWYEAGHALNDQAIEDRMAWLRQQLGL